MIKSQYKYGKKRKISRLHKKESPVLAKTEKEIQRIDRGVLENYNEQNESEFNSEGCIRRVSWIRN